MAAIALPQRVCVVGMGGLGCPASLGLALAGVPHLTLVDFDVVEPSNLHRQPWHHDADVGRLKVASAAEKLARAFPQLDVDAHATALTALNARALLAGHDVVIDGTDGADTKFLLSDTCKRLGVPLIHGGVLRFEGLAFRIEPQGPCLRCLFETPPTDAPTCAQAGVFGAMAGVVGGLQARLAVTPLERAGEAWLYVVDGGAPPRRVRLKRRPDCAVCAEERAA